MKTTAGRYKLFLIALLAAGCVSSTEPGAVSTPAVPLQPPRSQTIVSQTTPDAPAPETPSPTTEVEPRMIGPGQLVGTKGEQLSDGGRLEFTVLETPEGTMTVGVWSSLHPKFAEHLSSTPDFYLNSTVTVIEDKFVKVSPTKPLAESRLEAKAPRVKPLPGLAYANSKGDVLVSLGESAPPEGFVVIGQATVDQNSVEVWKTLKDGRKVESAGGLRT